MWRIFILLCLCHVISCGQYDKNVVKMEDVIEYLIRFGYLVHDWEQKMRKNPPRRKNESLVVQALKHWQDYNNIPVSGELDDITKQKMNDNRCANKDEGPTTYKDMLQQ
ncbi:hypothetical protein B4U80_13033, partial [Leptotrombidium deliense]